MESCIIVCSNVVCDGDVVFYSHGFDQISFCI